MAQRPAQMTSQQGSTDQEYLVLCRGRPSKDGFESHACRVDALTRITAATLSAGRILHAVFDDHTVFHITPDFLKDWAPWGRLGENDASEARLQTALTGALAGIEYAGIFFGGQPDFNVFLYELLKDGGPSKSVVPFDLVAILDEGGVELFTESSQLRRTCERNGQEMRRRILFVLGGVRDIAPEEEALIYETCQTLSIQRCLVSLGTVSELSSKCIKACEAATSIGVMSSGALAAVNPSQGRQGDIGKALGSSGKSEIKRPPLHIIYRIDMPLRTFLARPEAATLVVDTFRGSHHGYDNTLLTLHDTMNDALTLNKGDLDHILWADSAIKNMKDRLSKVRRGGIKDLLRDEYKMLCRKQDLKRLVILYADAAAPPLSNLQGGEFAQVAQRACSDYSTLCAVVVSRGNAAEQLREQLRALADEYVEASIGHHLFSSAFICLLHNSSLLLPAIHDAWAYGNCGRPHGAKTSSSTKQQGNSMAQLGGDLLIAESSDAFSSISLAASTKVGKAVEAERAPPARRLVSHVVSSETEFSKWLDATPAALFKRVEASDSSSASARKQKSKVTQAGNRFAGFMGSGSESEQDKPKTKNKKKDKGTATLSVEQPQPQKKLEARQVLKPDAPAKFDPSTRARASPQATPAKAVRDSGKQSGIEQVRSSQKNKVPDLTNNRFAGFDFDSDSS